MGDDKQSLSIGSKSAMVLIARTIFWSGVIDLVALSEYILRSFFLMFSPILRSEDFVVVAVIGLLVYGTLFVAFTGLVRDQW